MHGAWLMTSIAFTIPGEARGKGRPRASSYGGRIRLHSDAKTASYENLVKLAAVAAMKGAVPLDEPLMVIITARMVPPASVSKKRRTAMLAGVTLPTKKPDLDNVVKAVLDGCNGVAFRDDVLVVSQFAHKRYAETAGVDVVIEPLKTGAAS
jgi:Holliday junction resolvase RusA-like endonuclease